MNQDQVAALLREHADRHSVPGAALGILRDGTMTASHYGVEDVRSRNEVTDETRFSAGSLTKTMVAALIVRLANAGRLSLGDPVSAHVPELGRAGGWADHASIQDLLGNRAGLPLTAALESGFDAHRDDDDGALARLAAEVDPRAPRAAFWSYSNVGWALLGRVIETVAHGSWESVMEREVFERFGMHGTKTMTAADRGIRAAGHTVTSDGPVPVEPETARAYGPAGTTVVTTAGDLLRLAVQLLDDPSLAVLRDVQSTIRIAGWLDAWCLGLACFDWRGGPVWGWDGLIDGERSVLRILPDHRAAVALLTNADTGRAMYRSLFHELFEELFAIELPPWRFDPVPPGGVDLARFEGVYAWPDRRVEVRATATGLVIDSEGLARTAVPLDSQTFLVDASDPDTPTMTFGDFDAAGRPMVLYDMLWGLPRAP